MSLKCSECSQLLKSSCYYCCDKKEKYCINCSLHVCKRCKKQRRIRISSYQNSTCLRCKNDSDQLISLCFCQKKYCLKCIFDHYDQQSLKYLKTKEKNITKFQLSCSCFLRQNLVNNILKQYCCICQQKLYQLNYFQLIDGRRVDIECYQKTQINSFSSSSNQNYQRLLKKCISCSQVIGKSNAYTVSQASNYKPESQLCNSCYQQNALQPAKILQKDRIQFHKNTASPIFNSIKHCSVCLKICISNTDYELFENDLIVCNRCKQATKLYQQDCKKDKEKEIKQKLNQIHIEKSQAIKQQNQKQQKILAKCTSCKINLYTLEQMAYKLKKQIYCDKCYEIKQKSQHLKQQAKRIEDSVLKDAIKPISIKSQIISPNRKTFELYNQESQQKAERDSLNNRQIIPQKQIKLAKQNQSKLDENSVQVILDIKKAESHLYQIQQRNLISKISDQQRNSSDHPESLISMSSQQKNELGFKSLKIADGTANASKYQQCSKCHFAASQNTCIYVLNEQSNKLLTGNTHYPFAQKDKLEGKTYKIICTFCAILWKNSVMKARRQMKTVQKVIIKQDRFYSKNKNNNFTPLNYQKMNAQTSFYSQKKEIQQKLGNNLNKKSTIAKKSYNPSTYYN